MGLILSALGGAAGAGADILQRERETNLQVDAQKTMAKYNDELARQRDATAQELRQKYERDRVAWENSPEYLTMIKAGQGAARQAKVDDDTAQADGKRRYFQANKKDIIEEKQSLTDAGETTSTKKYNEERASVLKAARDKGTTDKPFKLDEDDKILLNSANTEVVEADKLLAKAMSDLGGRDPKEDAGVKFLQKRAGQARQTQFTTKIKLGLITPAEIADKIMSSSKTKAEALQEVNMLQNAAGSAFTEDVAALIYKADSRFGKLPQGDMTNIGPVSREFAAGAAANPAAPPGVPQRREGIVNSAAQAPEPQPTGSFKDRVAAVTAKQAKVAADPRIAELKAKQADALRRGKAAEANNYLAQINEITKAYGL